MYTQDPASQVDVDAEPRLQMDDVTPEQAAANQAKLQVRASAGPRRLRLRTGDSNPMLLHRLYWHLQQHSST
jgi:hypothetical protein